MNLHDFKEKIFLFQIISIILKSLKKFFSYKYLNQTLCGLQNCFFNVLYQFFTKQLGNINKFRHYFKVKIFLFRTVLVILNFLQSFFSYSSSNQTLRRFLNKRK